MADNVCPNCGAPLPRHARACPTCGADEHTGWSAAQPEGDLGLPDAEFDYDQFVRREFGTGQVKPPGISWLWWVVAVLLVVLFLGWSLRW